MQGAGAGRPRHGLKMVALPHPREWKDAIRRRTAQWRNLPSARTLATAAAVLITAILILKWGIWYFVGLIALYAIVDIAQRMEERRDGRIAAAILRSKGRGSKLVVFRGHARHCHRAAWVARELGWLARPMVREKMFGYAIRFLPVARAAPLSGLLQALSREKLITQIRMPDYLPKAAAPRTDRRLPTPRHEI